MRSQDFWTVTPLMYTRLEFSLAQDAVRGKVNAVEKVTLISQLPNRWGLLHALGVNPTLTPRIHQRKSNAKEKKTPH